jgi:TadE-like protein
MRGSMSPSRGSGKKWGLTFERTCADKTRMRSSWLPRAASAKAAAGAPARSRESGQALIEFALIAPLFLLLVVGIIQFGIGLNYWLDLNRIANQGARWAVVDKYPNCNGTVGSPGCVSPNTLQAHLESEPVSGGLQPTAFICFEDSAAGAVGEPLTVQVQSDFTFLPIMDLGTITLRGKATMRIEQTPVVMDAQGINQCP